MSAIRRPMVLMLGAALVVGPLGVASVAAAAPSKPVTLTSAQLTEQGFPKKPNVTAWAPGGSARISTNSAAQWQDVIIVGKAPKMTKPGQLLTMSRFIPDNTKGDGSLKPLNITTTVQANRTFSMRFQLGLVGTYGYRVGYLTDSATPELVGFQFQFTTTGSGKTDPRIGSATAPKLTSKQLARGGFTKTANTTAWSGTATLSTSKAPAGAPVTIKGTATDPIKPGTVLALKRFVPTDKLGSGSLVPVGNVETVVAADGTFALTFELNERGVYGYSLVAELPKIDEALGIEFQVRTT